MLCIKFKLQVTLPLLESAEIDFRFLILVVVSSDLIVLYLYFVSYFVY